MRKVLWGAIASLFGLAAGACSSGEPGEVKLGVTVAPLTTSASTSKTVTDPRADAGLAVTRVRVLVNVAKVGYAGHSDGDEVSIGPKVVDLTAEEIANGANRSFDLGPLDSGTYGGAEIEVDTPEVGAGSGSPELADFVSENASVIIDGSYQGTPFRFAGHFLAEQGTDGEVTVDASTPLQLPLTVDPSDWFLDADGAVMDPTDVAQHAAIASAICHSLDTQPQTGGGNGNGKHGGKAHCAESEG